MIMIMIYKYVAQTFGCLAARAPNFDEGGEFGGVEGLVEERTEGDSAGGEVVLGDASGIEFPEAAEEFVLFVLSAIEGEGMH